MREFCWKNRFEGEGFIEEQEKYKATFINDSRDYFKSFL